MPSSGKKSTRNLVMLMTGIVMTGFLVAGFYYMNLNRSVDPRIREARELYEQYNRIGREGDFPKIFRLLDSIENIYLATEHYQRSYEVGVLHNNRAAAMLTLALHRESILPAADPFPEVGFDSLVTMAEGHILQAMEIYTKWQECYTGQSDRKIDSMIGPGFMKEMGDHPGKIRERYLDRRVREIMDATMENDRRLSVCYSNLGLVFRHRGEVRKAAEHYIQALELWDRNLDAENNMNLLLGRPLRQRNLLQRLFPPGKENGTE